MAIPIYDQTLIPLSRMLHNLERIVMKAEDYVGTAGIVPQAILNARLYPDMHTFTEQIQLASDTAKGAAARLSGSEWPQWEDDERTFSELRDRINKTLEYLAEFESEQFNDSEQLEIRLERASQTFVLSGKDYLLHYVIPNFHFHVTIAYAILRCNGIQIGKMDYLGAHYP